MTSPGFWTIFAFIRNLYGSVALSNVRDYVNQSTSIIRLECHQDFNRQCLHRGFIPHGLRCKPLVPTPYGRKLARDFSRNCIKARIQGNKQWIAYARKRQASAERNLRHVLQYDDLRSIFIARKQAEDMERSKYSEIHSKKLARLQPEEPAPRNERTTIFNYSSKQLSDHHVSLLAKGLNFAMAPRYVPKRDFIVEIEEKLRHINNVTGVNLARSRVLSILNNAKPPQPNLAQHERKALQELRSDESIIIVRADKGGGTVILDRTDYDEKMYAIINDTDHFVKLPRDPTAKTERSLVDHLKELRKKGRLSDQLYRRLFSSDGSTPKLYGLPKVRNSQEFVQLIRAQTLLPHESMISFDVVSLFTNVSNDLAVDVARQRLLDDRTLSTRTSLHVDDIILLLRFCLNQCFFAFRGEVYHQVNGCPMGSPVSVTAANLVMEYIEEKVFGEIVFPVKFYRRYVDDTFVILDKNFVDDFHQCLNSVHPAIKFTYEPEQNNMLSFLDVCVIRTDEPNNRMETKVYRKPCDSGNFLDFLSHHPVQHKKSVVRTFVHRSNTVGSLYGPSR
uniref:Putative reverse transcriptase n=1 Tax=Ixodes ricinus TaxID=34613 RepID=A0A6B0VDL0_IXORI